MFQWAVTGPGNTDVRRLLGRARRERCSRGEGSPHRAEHSRPELASLSHEMHGSMLSAAALVLLLASDGQNSSNVHDG